MAGAIDKFPQLSGYASEQLLGPPREAFVATPSDTVELPFVTTWLLVENDGTYPVVMQDGTAISLPLAGKIMHPIRIRQIKATNVPSGAIVGFSA